ncbi:MAG: isochorismatase family protein [Chloroflexi bacterium]|nr:isochorismatase family protein [Chloroflexota bacterium]
MALPSIAAYAIPTELPTNRATWAAEPQRAALLIHDLQNYFIDAFPAGEEPISSVLRSIASLRGHAHALGIPVFYSAQPGDQAPEDRGLLSTFWGKGLSTGTPPEIVAPLAPQAGDQVITKWRYSAFQRTPLRELLREAGRDQLIVCGVYAHLGCLLTACDAFMQDIQPFFVADAVADFTLDEHRMALHYAAGRCAVVTTTEQLVRELGYNQLRSELHDLLDDVESIGADDNLLDWGLDSVRLMTLAERWRAAGCEVGFAELAETPTLAEWWQRRFAAQNLEQTHG